MQPVQWEDGTHVRLVPGDEGAARMSHGKTSLGVGGEHATYIQIAGDLNDVHLLTGYSERFTDGKGIEEKY